MSKKTKEEIEFKATIKQFEKEQQELYKELDKMERALRLSDNRRTVHTHYYFPDTSKGVHVRHGLISDTHLGNVYDNIPLLETLYDVFEREGLDTVYHCGDLLDGEKMYRGQEYELYAHGVDKQAENVIKKFPKRDGMNTYFITGNHDLSFQKHAGVDVGNLIAAEREDMIYLGQEDIDLIVGSKDKKIKLKLMHPSKGTAYALSYHPQKIVESFTGGKKPNALYIGHFHKAEILPNYRNVQTVQAGTTQKQTSFMQRNFIQAHQGGWIMDMYIPKNYQISRFRGEFLPYYEKPKYKRLLK